MKTERSSGRRLAAAVLPLLLAAAAPLAARAQQGVNLSDVSGTSVTTGDLLSGMFGEPGTLPRMTCPVAYGVRTASEEITASLGGAGVPGATLAARHPAAGAEVEPLRDLLTGTGSRAEAAAAVVAGLTPANNARSGARRAARRLVDRLGSLLAATNALNPVQPSPAVARQLSAAVTEYNSFVDASSDAFLTEPSAEFLAIQEVLSGLMRAAAANARRDANELVVDARGLGCAPPPPPEEPLAICVLTPQGLRELSAIYVPATADTLVVVDGQRRRFAEVYPGSIGYAENETWFIAQEPIALYGREYLRWGLPTVVAPADYGVAGRYRGIDVYTRRDATDDERSIFVAVRGCELQEYRPRELPVRG